MAVQVYPTAALAEIVGRDPTSHAEIMEKLLRYVDENHLTKSTDQQTIRCDPALQSLFGVKQLSVVDLQWRVTEHLV